MTVNQAKLLRSEVDDLGMYRQQQWWGRGWYNLTTWGSKPCIFRKERERRLERCKEKHEGHLPHCRLSGRGAVGEKPSPFWESCKRSSVLRRQLSFLWSIKGRGNVQQKADSLRDSWGRNTKTEDNRSWGLLETILR